MTAIVFSVVALVAASAALALTLAHRASKQQQITREEDEKYIVFRDKDGYIINTLKK